MKLNLTIEDIMNIIRFLGNYGLTISGEDKAKVLDLIKKLNEISL